MGHRRCSRLDLHTVGGLAERVAAVGHRSGHSVPTQAPAPRFVTNRSHRALMAQLHSKVAELEAQMGKH